MKRKDSSNAKRFGSEIMDDYSLNRTPSPAKKPRLIQKASLILPEIGSASFRKPDLGPRFFASTIEEKGEIEKGAESSRTQSRQSAGYRKRSSADSF